MDMTSEFGGDDMFVDMGFVSDYRSTYVSLGTHHSAIHVLATHSGNVDIHIWAQDRYGFFIHDDRIVLCY